MSRFITLVQIDGDVQMPTPSMGRPAKWPIRQMNVGDSFFTENLKARQMVGYAHRKGYGRFASRIVTEDGVKGIRIWRVG